MLNCTSREGEREGGREGYRERMKARKGREGRREGGMQGEGEGRELPTIHPHPCLITSRCPVSGREWGRKGWGREADGEINDK